MREHGGFWSKSCQIFFNTLSQKRTELNQPTEFKRESKKKGEKKKIIGSGGIRTHAIEMTGA